MREINSIYEKVKNNKVGWSDRIIIDDKLYLVFVRQDEKIENQTEVVFRELIKE